GKPKGTALLVRFKSLIFGLLLGIFTGCGDSETSVDRSPAASAGNMADKQTLQETYQRLLSNRVFAFGGVGYAGVTSEGEKAFQAIAVSAKTLMSANPSVRTMSGCLMTEDRASNVVAQIIRGQYDSYINRHN